MHTTAAFACATAGSHTSTLTTDTVAVPGSPVTREPAQVVLSPNGKYVAYTLEDSLWVAPVDRAGVARGVIGGVRGEASSPFPILAWSPDERSLLYRSDYGAGDAGTSRGEVRILNLATGASTPFFPDSLQRTLRTFQNFLAGGPAWSPDGRYVAILAVRQADPQYGLQVYVADLHDHTVSRWTAEGRRRWSVSWSPDSRLLAVASGEFTGQTASIELLDVARRGADTTLIYHAPTALLRRLLWSPSGRLLFARDRGGKVYLLAIDNRGGATAVVHRLPAANYSAWLPGDTALIATVSERMSNRVVTISLSNGAKRYLTGPDSNATAIGLSGTAATTPLRLIYRMESGSIPPDIWSSPLGGAAGVPRDNITRSNAGIAASKLPGSVIYQWSRGDGSPGLAQLLLPHSVSLGSRAAHLPLVVIPYGAYDNSFPRSDYFLDEGILSLISAGYAVVKPNTRGRASESDDSARYGAVQLYDTELLLDALAKEGVIDPRRVATIGHSHGGAMAYYYLTHSARFCAVVAVNGRADWILQARHPATDGVLPGALGGTPDSLPERYREFSPAANARRATASLLAVAGDLDTQILPENVTIMGDSMRVAGKVVETIRFPDEGHLLLKPEHRRLFWNRVFHLLKGAC